VIVTTRGEAETSAVGRRLAQTLTAGSIVLLIGDLGAGKTALVRGLAEGLGIPPEEVSSPTFTLMQEYRGGRVTLIHVDLSRLDDAREIDDLGLEELGMDSVLAIEWAEKLPQPPAGAIRIAISHAGESERRLDITPSSGTHTL
jgi:tRNA threonylcarbamoyladenosine biosynthesis protein TsaE